MQNQFKNQNFKHLMLAMGPRDLNSAPYSPVHCSSHSMTSFQSSELTELPAVENSQLFAQRAHSARYAPRGGTRLQGPIGYAYSAPPLRLLLPTGWNTGGTSPRFCTRLPPPVEVGRRPLGGGGGRHWRGGSGRGDGGGGGGGGSRAPELRRRPPRGLEVLGNGKCWEVLGKDIRQKGRKV